MAPHQLVFGSGAIEHVRGVLVALHARRIFLVTGRDSYRRSGAERALLAVLAGGIDAIRFDDFTPNPMLQDLERGVSLCRALQPDVVVAVGGGSAMDVGKVVNLLAAQELPPAVTLASPPSTLRQPPAMIAVPTTAGSGSEATSIATMYVNGVKRSLAHEWLRPRCAIVDPCLSCSMSPRLTAVTGLDALTQAIESYWSVGATVESRLFAKDALAKTWGTLPSAVHSPDATTRSTMAHGAYLAGCAIDISRTTAAHALSYVLTQRYGVPHGLAVALTLATLFEHGAEVSDADIVDPRGPHYVREKLAELCAMLGCASLIAAAAAWRSLLESVGVPTRLRDVGVQDRHLDELIAGVNTERLGNHPFRLSPGDLRRIVRRAM